MGNLNIPSTFCTSSALTQYNLLVAAFSQVTEIRGFFSIVGGSCIPNLLFLSNLVVIHGDAQYGCTNSVSCYSPALIIDQGGASPSTSANSLRSFGLLSLTTVRGGGIRIPYPVTLSGYGTCGRFNSYLASPLQGADFLQLAATGTDVFIGASPAYLINLNRTLPDNSVVQLYVEQDQRQPSNGSSVCAEPFCDASCNNKCWLSNNASACQKICTATCGDAGCQDGNLGTCCSASCLGGCDSTGKCKACANGLLRNSDGTCTSACSNGQLQYGLARKFICGTHLQTFVQPMFCVATCPAPTVSNGTHCVLSCPGGADAVNGVCPSTAGNYTVCQSVQDISSVCELNLVVAEGCNTIYGSLFALSTSDLLGANSATLQGFQNIVYVMGFLEFFQTNFTNFNFLSNLQRVGGRFNLGGGVVVNIMQNNNLTTLGLYNLRTIGGPTGSKIILRDNFNQCYVDTIALAEIVSTIANVTLSQIYTTTPNTGYVALQIKAQNSNLTLSSFVNQTVNPLCGESRVILQSLSLNLLFSCH